MIIKTMVKLLSWWILAAVLAGCSTMSKDECLKADWYLKGLADANEGYARDRVNDHARACARVGVQPNVQDYAAGHQKGARLYCVPGNGYSAGRSGASYNGICPMDLENNFLRAYRDGQELFDIEQKINYLNNEIASNQSRIDFLYEQARELKRDIIDRDSDSQERRNKLRSIDMLQNDITELEIRIDRDVHEAELFKRDYRIVQDKHYRMGYIQ